MCIYPPSIKVATVPEDAIANAVFCCGRKFARLRQQVQQLQGMKIRSLDWNTKQFYLILAISSIKSNTPTHIKDELDSVYGDSTPSFTTVEFSLAEFKCGRKNLGDDERSGRPNTATTVENVAKVQQVVLDERRIKPSSYGHEFVGGTSRARVLVLLKTRRVEKSMHIKSVKVQCPEVLW
ncbi:HTH_48 domain-containing protein [Trichonephila clavipes]|nr:HTH_48 domain-containing protein [Trichonephila clavipes]